MFYVRLVMPSAVEGLIRDDSFFSGNSTIFKDNQKIIPIVRISVQKQSSNNVCLNRESNLMHS